MATLNEHAASHERSLKLERLLQINVGTLVILGTSLLAMGQRNVIYALVAVIATSTAIVVTDWKRIFRLGPDATTLAAIFACVVLVVQVIRNVEQSQLLNVANILIYLQVILLFQEKQDRTYWSLMALSLLQVIVAAALNLGLIFGVLLAIYVLAGGTALMLFFAVREIRPFVRAGAADQSTSTSGPAAAERWGRTPFIGQISGEVGEQIINRALFRRLGRMLAITALATVVLFFAIPRFNSTAWESADENQVTTVGFTEEVGLDDIGRILESPEQVMRVEFTDLEGNPYQVDGEPYFHGTVLSSYGRRGRWQQDRHRRFTRPLSTLSSFDLANTVLQRVTLQPGSHSVLFHTSPCYPVDATPSSLHVNLITGQLTLSDEDDQGRGSFRYTLGTTAFRNGWQHDMVPASGPASGDAVEWLVGPGREQMLESFPTLVEVADSVIEQLSLDQAGMFERCKALENHFTRSGIYRYSLNVNQNRDRRLDPIEDFVGNHRTGHCEYFAGALTLMLRSQVIPARMVVGYRGGEFNAVGNYYIVRQLHAHAWVEAYLSPDEIPEDEFEANDFPEHGCWLRLDPTPDVFDSAQDDSNWVMITTVREFIDYCQVLWDDYVLGLNSTRQQQAIYGPVTRGFQMVVTSLFSADARQEHVRRLRGMATRIIAHRTFGIPSYWLVLLIIAGLALLGGRHRAVLSRRVGRILARWRRRRSAQAHDRPQLEAYRRFEAAVAPLGLVRPPNQTHFEFAAVVSGRLNQLGAVPSPMDVPQRITDAYYRFRFGNQQLTDDEQGQLLTAVQQLEAFLNTALNSAARPQPA
jgi:transglutaminase-like putative cysteine protease